MVSANTPSPALFALLAGSSFVGLALAFSVSGYHVLGPLFSGRSVPADQPSAPAAKSAPQAETSARPLREKPSPEPKAEASAKEEAASPGSDGQKAERDGLIRKVPNFPSAVVRYQPKSKAGIQDGLRPGHRVSVIGRKGYWLHIEYENRSGKTVQGWTHEVNVTVP